MCLLGFVKLKVLSDPCPAESFNLTHPLSTVNQSDFQMQILLKLHKLNGKQCTP